MEELNMATVEDRVEAWVWPADVLALAKEKGVAQYLNPMLDMTRRRFLNARQLRVLVEEDWDIPNLRAITFAVQIVGLNPEEYVKACHDWDRESIIICPRSQVGIFGLWLESVDA
jgi:hypothetical protein